MKFNTKTRYGIRTMLEIGLNRSHEGMFQKNISKNQNISFKYLDHIISSLKASGLIANLKGKKSGYILTKDPAEISIYDIYKAFEPKLSIVDCLSESIECPRENQCAPRDFWEGLNHQIIEYLSKYTLEDLIDNQLSYKSQENSHLQDKA